MSELSELDELLAELSDALLVPSLDNCDRFEHIDQIDSVLSSTSSNLHGLLLTVRKQLIEDSQRDPMWFAIDENRDLRLQLVQSLRAHMTGSGCLYHGTVRGRLAKIFNTGLDPEAKRVWRDTDVDRSTVGEGVFFDTTWRGATSWAYIASSRSRGPKNSWSRKPVILRLLRGDHAVEPDPLATAPGCVFIKGVVSVEGAEVLLEPFSGFPRWVPIEQCLGASQPNNELPRPSVSGNNL
ncbi:hypothetical protein FIU93_01435 [Labrenzia sp. THAF35]|nr:hypothetical protein FIU93_01435 [Labrenzia sp. THAF35]